MGDERDGDHGPAFIPVLRAEVGEGRGLRRADGLAGGGGHARARRQLEGQGPCVGIDVAAVRLMREGSLLQYRCVTTLTEGGPLGSL